ncbi:MAG: DUF262 domain-containing HNH endonuclease family protein [Oscillospiraceae bacterium]|jgi:uncharacterized protein with ParB-like and HNH nuclease domain|nr:DUF262 domain-containing HNH endonuclease family protein [Oscillospiraceae bacterium]
MAFQTPLTIAKVITDIDQKKYLLPSIQREFVWKEEQIVRLFDSIMKGYPINSFLFWKISREKAAQFKFYEFIRDYHQTLKKHNIPANINGNEGITAILDGQQRLTSLYISLKGSYSSKLPNKQWDNPKAFPEKRLYLNLFKKSEEEDLEYNFEFLTKEESERNDEEHFWFPVGEILNIKDNSEIMQYLISKKLIDNKMACNIVSSLFEVIHNKQTINYYLEESDKLDKVLNIFIRVNSGGTTLSYSDLLLSFATAQWEKLDAREEINKFVDEINSIGQGFNLNKDIVLKACLVLCDIQDIAFKVDNFNKNTMLKIENEWGNITEAIRCSVNLVSSFGFSSKNITSNNLFIPIAYYFKTIGLPNNFETSDKFKEDRKAIKKWFVSSLLKRIFSFAPDGALKPIRDIIKSNENKGFPTESIIERFSGTNRSLKFGEEDYKVLLNNKYGERDTLVVLSILYPWAKLRNNFEIDHIFPQNKFTKTKLDFPQEKINEFTEKFNYIGNLQLLEKIPNIQKSDKDFNEWLINEHKNEEELKDYKKKHFIPNVDLSFDNFLDFFAEREKLLIECLKKELE